MTAGTIKAQPKAKTATGGETPPGSRCQQPVGGNVEYGNGQHDAKTLHDLVLGFDVAGLAAPIARNRP